MLQEADIRHVMTNVWSCDEPCPPCGGTSVDNRNIQPRLSPPLLSIVFQLVKILSNKSSRIFEILMHFQ